MKRKKQFYKISSGLALLLLAYTFTFSRNANEKQLRILSLGDSYTIGEGVAEEDRFPNQLANVLKQDKKHTVLNPEIIAQTGWTTQELIAAIGKRKIKEQYDFVTLCIGVNNQYRKYPLDTFESEFTKCLEKAISLGKNAHSSVMVLSIPDWGVTPYASLKEFDPIKIGDEIDAHNEIIESICKKYNVHYIDIICHYRLYGHEKDSYVEDQLHPSKKIYKFWAESCAKYIKEKLSSQ